MARGAKISPALLALSGPFTKIARTMSKNWDVEIIPSGHKCATDGTRIWIPFAADHLPPERQAELHGLLDHEVCHVLEERHYKMRGEQTPLELARGVSDGVVKMFFNVFEDVRIERKWSARYPGVAENLERANKASVAKISAAGPKGSAWNRLGAAVLCRLFRLDESWFDPGTQLLMEFVQEEIDSARFMVEARDALEIATRLVEKLRTIAAPDEEAEGEEAEGAEAEGKEAEGAGAEGEEAEGAGAEGKEAEGAGAEGEEAEGEEAEGEEAEGEEAEGEEAEVRPKVDGGASADQCLIDAATALDDGRLDWEDITDALRERIEESAFRDASDHARYVPNPMYASRDAWVRADGGSVENYNKALEDVASQLGALRGRQLAVIQTITRKRIVTGLEEGRLDDALLASVRMGARDVFQGVKKGLDVDTAFEVMIDLSGSMGNGDDKIYCAYYAKRTAIALAESWESLRVPYEIAGFYNVDMEVHARPPGFVNRGPFRYMIFKGWNERLAACRQRFQHIRGYQGNADGEAVYAAAERLAARSERRKILVVISDGRPAAAGASLSALERHLRETLRRITRAGIEVIGVGAGSDCVRDYYTKANGAECMVIKNVNELAPELYKALSEKLRRRR